MRVVDLLFSIRAGGVGLGRFELRNKESQEGGTQGGIPNGSSGDCPLPRASEAKVRPLREVEGGS